MHLDSGASRRRPTIVPGDRWQAFRKNEGNAGVGPLIEIACAAAGALGAGLALGTGIKASMTRDIGTAA
jgi:hypothetical protein